MGRLWESLDDDYRNYLSNICTQEEFEAASLIDRAHLRKQFLDCVKSQKVDSPTEIIAINSDSDRISEPNNTPRRSRISKAKIATPSPSNKRKSSALSKCVVKKEQVSPKGGEGRKKWRSAWSWLVTPDGNMSMDEIPKTSLGKTEMRPSDRNSAPSTQIPLKIEENAPKIEAIDDTHIVESCVDNDLGTNVDLEQTNEAPKTSLGKTEIRPSDRNSAPSTQIPPKIEAIDNTHIVESSVDNGLGTDVDREQTNGTKDNSSGDATQQQGEGDIEERKVQKEEDNEAAKKDAYEKYGDLKLLHRFAGVNRLGGGTQMTFQRPGMGCQKVFDGGNIRPGYPLPKEGFEIDADGKYNTNTLTALCYNTTWQINGPKFAGQPTAAVNCVPGFMRRDRLVLPVFMKRSLTKKDAAREMRVLGWEYVGHYRWVPDDGIMMWEKADNFSQASKREIAEKVFQSSQSKTGNSYGRDHIDGWREKLTKEEKQQNDKNEPHDPNSMISRALKLGFKSNMSDRDLAYLMTELDEYHGLDVIEFVYYDMDMYNYCSKGLTTKNSKGGIHANEGGRIATARDWYNFRDANML